MLTNQNEKLTEYLPKILGFAYMKMNNKEEAEDLAQDIALQVLKAINAGKQIDNWSSFIWSVSNHTFCKRIRSKKYNTMYLNESLMSDEFTEDALIEKEEQNLLRREVALLSKKYREAVVLHYFDGKTCEGIAQIQGRSAGTVKWLLHDARKIIKEGMNIMREYGIKSVKPGKLFMSCQGHYGADYEPMSCAKRASAQNILLAAYKEPMTVEELSIELGISAPYIEDEVAYLTENQLMKEITGGKYQTDFVILPGKNPSIAKQIYDICFPAYSNELLAFLEKNKDELIINKANFSWERLLWVYLHMFTELNLDKFRVNICKVVVFNDMPIRPNGGRWIALGFDQFVHSEWCNDSKIYYGWDGPVHKSSDEYAQGFFHNWSGLDSSIFFDLPHGVFALCREIIHGKPVDELDESEKYLFSIAIEKKLFIKDGDEYRLNYYFVEREEYIKIEELAKEFYATAEKYFAQAWQTILAAYKSDVPIHLRWQMGNFLSNNLNCFVTCSIYEAWKKELLSLPDENNKAWLSLFATE